MISFCDVLIDILFLNLIFFIEYFSFWYLFLFVETVDLSELSLTLIIIIALLL